MPEITEGKAIPEVTVRLKDYNEEGISKASRIAASKLTLGKSCYQVRNQGYN